MKKRVYGKKLSRGRGSRKALFRSLVKALVENGSIKTTKTKAKAVQGDVDGLVNMAKDGSLAKIRMLYAKLANDKKASKKLIDIIAKRMKTRNSGYTRIIPLPQRRGDMAEMARLEWVVSIKDKPVAKDNAKKPEKEEKKSIAEKLKSMATRSKKAKNSKESNLDKKNSSGKKK